MNNFSMYVSMCSKLALIFVVVSYECLSKCKIVLFGAVEKKKKKEKQSERDKEELSERKKEKKIRVISNDIYAHTSS